MNDDYLQQLNHIISDERTDYFHRKKTLTQNTPKKQDGFYNKERFFSYVFEELEPEERIWWIRYHKIRHTYEKTFPHKPFSPARLQGEIFASSGKDYVSSPWEPWPYNHTFFERWQIEDDLKNVLSELESVGVVLDDINNVKGFWVEWENNMRFCDVTDCAECVYTLSGVDCDLRSPDLEI